MSNNSIKDSIKQGTFTCCSPVEGNFFGMSNDARMSVSEFTFEALFFGSVTTERRRDALQDPTRSGKVPKHQKRSFSTKALAQFPSKQPDIHKRLRDIRVQVRQGIGKFDNVLTQDLVNVLQTIVKVDYFVESQIVQVLLMGVLSQASTKRKAQARNYQLDRIVDKAHRPHHHSKHDYSIFNEQAPITRHNGTNNAAIEGSKPNVQPSTKNQNTRQSC